MQQFALHHTCTQERKDAMITSALSAELARWVDRDGRWALHSCLNSCSHTPSVSNSCSLHAVTAALTSLLAAARSVFTTMV